MRVLSHITLKSKIHFLNYSGIWYTARHPHITENIGAMVPGFAPPAKNPAGAPDWGFFFAPPPDILAGKCAFSGEHLVWSCSQSQGKRLILHHISSWRINSTSAFQMHVSGFRCTASFRDQNASNSTPVKHRDQILWPAVKTREEMGKTSKSSTQPLTYFHMPRPAVWKIAFIDCKKHSSRT